LEELIRMNRLEHTVNNAIAQAVLSHQPSTAARTARQRQAIGSQKALNCSFVPTLPGPPEFYSGVINKLGVDLGGTSGGVMVWAVYAPTTRAAGFLAGTYAGASAEVTVGGGIGANMLVGGSFRTVELQPFTVQEQTGINLAAGIAEIELHFVR
jgi:hypothetical protein